MIIEEIDQLAKRYNCNIIHNKKLKIIYILGNQEGVKIVINITLMKYSNIPFKIKPDPSIKLTW